MSVQEWWLELETKLEQARRMESHRVEKKTGFSSDEWDELRALYKQEQAKHDGTQRP